jgi:hypothetical protein
MPPKHQIDQACRNQSHQALALRLAGRECLVGGPARGWLCCCAYIYSGGGMQSEECGMYSKNLLLPLQRSLFIDYNK